MTVAIASDRMVNILNDAVVAYNTVWLALNTYNLSAFLRRSGGKDDSPTSEQLERFKAEHAGKFPNISILLPAYKEERVLSVCIDAIERSDYPKEGFEVLLMLERDDVGTCALAASLAERYSNVKPVILGPKQQALGKPRALNEGLKLARGSIVGVLDAEDIIESDLLLAAAYMMTERGCDAVQGVLDMANDSDGWKNLMQRAEYGYWFRRHLPALAKANYPVPFGGTTNFFKKSLLEELGGWDPNNLTEDFDLGIRLYNLKSHRSQKASGHSHGQAVALKMDAGQRAQSPSLVESQTVPLRRGIATIKAVTREESPITMGAWMRQRTRWEQGKIETLKKNLKDPPEGAVHKMHTYAAAAWPHMAAINITGLGLGAYAFIEGGLSVPVDVLAGFNMAMIGFYATMNAVGYLDATKQEKGKIRFRGAKAAIAAITLPAYWIMQWAADLRAMKLEYMGSRVWEKTDHLGRHFKDEQATQDAEISKQKK